jgi:hypothetical protein
MPPEGRQSSAPGGTPPPAQGLQIKTRGRRHEDDNTRITRRPSPRCPSRQEKMPPPLQRCPPPSKTHNLSIQGRRPGIHVPAQQRQSPEQQPDSPSCEGAASSGPAWPRSGLAAHGSPRAPQRPAHRRQRHDTARSGPPQARLACGLPRSGPSWRAALRRGWVAGHPAAKICHSAAHRTSTPAGTRTAAGRIRRRLPAPPLAATAPRGRPCAQVEEDLPPPAPHGLCPAALAGGGKGEGEEVRRRRR